MKLKWNFQRGVGVQTKIPSMGGVWVFSGTTQSCQSHGQAAGEEATQKNKENISMANHCSQKNLLSYHPPQEKFHL